MFLEGGGGMARGILRGVVGKITRVLLVFEHVIDRSIVGL